VAKLNRDLGTIPEPTELLRPGGRTSNIKFPLPHARSPMKTHTGSSPRRSVGPLSPSKRHEADTPTRAVSHPPPSSLAKRKFDDSINEPTPRSSTLKRPKKTPPSTRSTRNSFNVEDQSEPEETTGLTNGDITNNGYIDEETPLPGIEDDSMQIDQNQEHEDEPVEEGAAAKPGALGEEPSTIPETTQPEKPAPRKRGRPSLNANAEDSQLSLSAAKPRGRPPKVHQDAPTEEPTNTNKPKGRPKRTALPLQPVPADRGPNAKISSRRNSITKAASRSGSVRPGARSLLIQRSETPAEGSGALVTRSGRHSIKPLASWRGERAVFDCGIIEDNGLTLGGIREIIRTDEIIEPRPKRPAGKRRKAKLEDVEEDDEDMEDWERDTGVMTASIMAWDSVEGHFIEDQVDTQGSFFISSGVPCLLSCLIPKIKPDIAYAASAIEMRDISGAEFRFAKTLTLPFFGSGIVDLPPGGSKRSKNSRKMQMVFFVFYGRVTVEIGTPVARFGIGKGGQWQVPRGES